MSYDLSDLNAFSIYKNIPNNDPIKENIKKLLLEYKESSTVSVPIPTKNTNQIYTPGLIPRIPKLTNTDGIVAQLDANIKCKVAPSSIHGVGLFAVCDIDEGEDILKDTNSRYLFISEKDIEDGLDSEKILEVNKLANFEDGGYWIHEDWNVVPLSCFLNHSIDSNVTSVPGGQNKYNFRARRDIKKDEELLWNYYESGRANNIYYESP